MSGFISGAINPALLSSTNNNNNSASKPANSNRKKNNPTGINHRRTVQSNSAQSTALPSSSTFSFQPSFNPPTSFVNTNTLNPTNSSVQNSSSTHTAPASSLSHLSHGLNLPSSSSSVQPSLNSPLASSSTAKPTTTTTTTTTTPAPPVPTATSAISQFVPRPTTTTQTFLPEFWSHIIRNAEEYQSDFKDGQLPLARIKKLVKSDPDIKMIANEVTVLLDKACEIFVNEITVRAFLVANSLNRRTVNTTDVAMAISQSDMFDFLIDIVPTEQLQPEGDSALPACSSSSTSPTTAPKSSTTRKRRSTMPKVPEDANQTEPIVPTPLPSVPPPLPPKKKPKNNRVNRNLLPEEVAVPIPDTELIKREPSPELRPPKPPNGRSLAIPIPDSELIPPRASEQTWELAVPIFPNQQQTSNLPSTSAKAWEMAVPLSDSSSHRLGARNWEIAVPISNDLSQPSHHPSHKRGRNWDLAVPIVDEAQEDSDHPSLENTLDLKRDSLPSPGPNHDNYQRPSNPKVRGNNQRNWELAVPIVDHQSGPSHQGGQMMPSSPNSRHQSNRPASVPIDPALFDLAPSMKLTSDLINPHVLPHREDPPNISIKQEE